MFSRKMPIRDLVRPGLILSMAVTSALAQAATAPTARIDSGVVEGMRDGDVSAFLGVSFAADTSGANRRRAPQPVKPWKQVRKAAAYDDNCPQVPGSALPAARPWTDEYKAPGPASEKSR
ncbi:carboxylesterase family protein [Sphingobium sp. JS3065]|uniref:carboxylesterase family protein n=1 Tax=Sphingobium sp. JS3065 TaxID=2970925 RepID=UPI002264389E|nr:carboxylesterase family protein [Sphingobium sp. JS3065]UZW57372.1 carboxylesterase family protein [Sphingobium sp. JS3065]